MKPPRVLSRFGWLLFVATLTFATQSQGQNAKVEGPETKDDSAASLESEEVVVQGSRVPRVMREPEVTATVIRGEALRQPGADLADVLGREAGVQVNRTGTAADLATASIRGSDGSQVPVYLAGIRLNDDIVGVADLSRVPLFLVDRIEIYRGALPQTVHRDGMNGAILMEPVTPSTSALRLGMTAGSFSFAEGYAATTGRYQPEKNPSAGLFATTIAVRRAGAENDFTYESDAGTAFVGSDDSREKRLNADYIESDVWLLSRGSWPRKSGRVSLQFLYNHFEREQGVSGLALLPAQAARSALARDLVGVASRLRCATGNCLIGLSSSFSSTRLTTTDPSAELALGAESVRQENERGTQEANLDFDLTPSLRASLGGMFEGSRIAISAPELPLARAKEATFGANVGLGYQASRWLTRGVLRGTCVDAEGSEAGTFAASPRELSWSQCQAGGRLGAEVWAHELVRLRAVAARGVRFPTLGERFGVSAVTRGNSELAVEKAWSADVGATFESRPKPWGNFWVDGSLFGRQAEDLVAFERSSLGYVRPYNVGRSRFLGAELALEVSAFGHVRSRTNGALLDPRNVTVDRPRGNDLIPFRSQLTASEELEIYSKNPDQTVSYRGLVAYLTYRSGRVADPAGLLIIPDQLVFDVVGRLQLQERLDLRLRGENLFQSARFDSLGFPLPGRAVFLSATLTSD